MERWLFCLQQNILRSSTFNKIEEWDFEKVYLTIVDFRGSFGLKMTLITAERNIISAYGCCIKHIFQDNKDLTQLTIEDIDKYINEGITEAKIILAKKNSIGKLSSTQEGYSDKQGIFAKEIKDLITQGDALYDDGDFNKSITCYDKVIKIYPEYPDIWIRKAYALSKLGKENEAIMCCDKAISLNPKDALNWYNKGVILSEMNKWEEAIYCFDKSLDINPNDANTWHNKGNALYWSWKFEESLECIKKAIEIDSTNGLSWFIKAMALTMLKKYDEAIDSYDKAIEIMPTDADTRYYKSIALLSSNKHEEALKSIEEAIAINKDEINLNIYEAHKKKILEEVE